ncbi:hypothetical protein IHE45_02G064700 [Dioscorea alata]|uniref:Uncharacterized protein n=1 Tax=Dioscorea alata TaxID=55571 RepID=A0ACB7WR66_DIOAL|nr:hypothetical protein IHE45_02G064700 [Dioscorea alata]
MHGKYGWLKEKSNLLRSRSRIPWMRPHQRSESVSTLSALYLLAFPSRLASMATLSSKVRLCDSSTCRRWGFLCSHLLSFNPFSFLVLAFQL